MNISDLPHKLQSQLEYDIAQAELIYLQSIVDESVKDRDYVLETYILEVLCAHFRLMIEWASDADVSEHRSVGMVGLAANLTDDISRRAYIEKDPHAGAPDREFWIPLFQARVRRALETSGAWEVFIKCISELASQECSDAPEPLSETTPAQRIEEFLRVTSEASNRKLTKSDISIVAGYHDRSSFQRFQRGAGNLTQALNFERVLSMSPLAFIDALDRIKSRSK